MFAPSNVGEECEIYKENPEEDVEFKGKERPEHRQDLRKEGKGGRTRTRTERSRGEAGRHRSAQTGPTLGDPRPGLTGALTWMG